MNQYRRVQYSFGGSGMSSIVKKLLIANGIIFVVQMMFPDNFTYFFSLIPHLALSRLQIWRFISYMFLHGSMWHIVMNMYVLWMFGSEIERMWGTRVFLQYYFVTGIGAGLLYALVNFNSMIPTIGASGAVYGILVAFAILFPDRQLMLLFPPIPMRAKTMVAVFVGLELIHGIRSTNDGIAHLAHLGGALVGYLFIKNYQIVKSIDRKYNDWRRKQRMQTYHRQQQEEDKMRERVDEILDKANRVGIENLSNKEKDTLRKAGKYYGS